MVKPKKKCCRDQPRCKRCPIRLLAAGQLSSDQARKIFTDSRNQKALKAARKKEKLPAVA